MTNQENKADNGAKSSDELRADLDQTRERVSSDVEALGNKLSPENLKAEAKQAVSRSWEQGRELVRDKVQRGTDLVRETVENTENTVLGYVRENPVPLSLIGVGLGLLIWNGRTKGNGHRQRPDPSRYGRSEVYEGLDRAETSRAGSGGDHHLDHLKDRVRSGVATVKHAAADTAHHAREKLDNIEHRAAEQGQRAKALAERTWEDQPVVLGALALGVGLAVGLGIPATESENQLVGQYRDRLFGTVKEKARELEGKAEQALHTAADSFKEQGEKGASQPA